MKQYLGTLYALLFGRPCFQWLNKAAFYLSARGLGLFNYESLRISGERYVIGRFIKKSGSPVVFDVGANAGAWSAEVLKHNSSATLHLFEPQAALASTLKSVFPLAQVNNVAVADEAGTLQLHDYEDGAGSSHATLVNRVIETVHQKKARSIEVDVISLDDYCERNTIGWIDFLKVDVEGFEYKVLTGAQNMVRAGQIGVIQFEFNSMNQLTRVFVKDFIDFLGDGYRVYRALPSGLLPLDPRSTWINEQFAFQNIVAVSKGWADA